MINERGSSCKVLVMLVRFVIETWNSSKDFRKSVQWESSCPMRTDGRTDRRTWRI